MTTSITQTSACPQADILTKANPDIEVLLPSNPNYHLRESSYWSKKARIQPAYIVRPVSADEVAATLRVLVASDEKFAIRSGGHTPHAGASNIAGGVTIDLGRMDWTRFDADTETVDIGPGGRWNTVYGELEKHNRVVAGGRDGNVGVGGLLLGGGKTLFTRRRGFACDDVIAYEVVLGDGKIVTADATNNVDLFWALKGGSNNFGIVTNFTMRALRCDKIWAGLNIFPKQMIPEASQALVEFTANEHMDPDSNLLCFFAYTVSQAVLRPDFKDIVVIGAFAQVAGIEKAASYEKWLSLPSKIMDTCKMTTVAAAVIEYNVAPPDYHDIFFTANFKNDVRIVEKAAELHEQLVDELKELVDDGNFITQCLFQPLPTMYGQRSKEAGGNAIGIEDQPVDGLNVLALVEIKEQKHETVVYPKVKTWLKDLRVFAATIENGNLEWEYLSYADGSQNPLASYGRKNVQRMRAASAKYDPGQVFQRLCPGGFKLADVETE